MMDGANVASAKPEKSATGSVAAVEHAIEILKTISTAGKPIGVNEIARSVSVHKSTVSRTLKTLKKHGLVERRSDNDLHQLGYGLMILAAPLLRNADIVNTARDILSELAEKSGETVSLYQWDGAAAVSVYQALGAHAVQHFAPPGRRNPAHSTAAGKAFLSAFDDAILEQVIAAGLTNHTTNTICDPQKLRDEIQEARQCGFSVNNEEFVDEVSAVGAPIFDIRGDAVASIAVTVPKYRFSQEHKVTLCKQVVDAAHRLSGRLGHAID